MSQGPLCPNLTKKVQKEVSQMANCKVIRVSMHTTRYTLARPIINKDRPV